MQRTDLLKPVLSIITVVYNAEPIILKTLESVWNQTYPGIEYIIIDGASKDGTLELLKLYHARFSHLQSEPDKGIYDAMNKGLARATGEYVLFLNAGDELAEVNTVEKIFLSADNPGPAAVPGFADLYYGKVLLIDGAGISIGERRHKPPVRLTWKSFRMGMMVSHQAFIPALAITAPYRTDMKISADIDWCISCMKKARSIVNTELYISKYMTGGISRQNTWLSWKERFSVMKKHYGLATSVFYHFIIILRFTGYYLTSRRLD